MSVRVNNSASSGGSTISQLTTDPTSPTANQAWVLKIPDGVPMGLLLALTYTSSPYLLSYYTNAGTIVRTTLA